MIYPSDFETRLGFDRLRESLSLQCSTLAAREMVEAITFSSDRDHIFYSLSLVEEIRHALDMEENPPLGGYTDINGFLKRLRLDGTFIELGEMRSLQKALVAVRSITRFFTEKEIYPLLKSLSMEVIISYDIIGEIRSIVDESGKMRDSASPELATIRQTLHRREREVSKRLRAIMGQAINDGIVEEGTNISIREGRAVIPVSAANKRKIRGLIHDESATGKTAYVEPIEVVEMNNEIKALESDEHREMVRILTHFTEKMRPHIPDLLGAGDFLAHIDFLHAKSRIASQMGAVMPQISDQSGIWLKDARHPLLEKTLRREGKEIVPLDIELNPQKHILVISGPNAGGKSVCLKSVGLLQYMFQCGMSVPVSANSQMGIFKKIFIDIGDQQSIDNDLSTYSSHLLNMKMVLRHSDRDSLVLIDEFGTGTEPAMGGAIAETILERLEERGVFGVITTHYSNLKYYASHSRGVQNGAMSFDVQHIRPLFSLEMGKPGSSFAFEIARKSGLSEDVVKSAEEKLGEDKVNIERQLRQIARDKRYWENKRDKIRVADKRTDQVAEQYERELEELHSSRNKLLREAKEEAARIVAEANRQIENTIRQIKESQAEKERTKAARASLEQFRQEAIEEAAPVDEKIERKMQKLREREQRRGNKGKIPKKEDVKSQQRAKAAVEVGSMVVVKGQNVSGEVLSIQGKDAVVAFGSISMTVKMARLEVTSKSQIKKQATYQPPVNLAPETSGNYDVRSKQLEFKSKVDVRGYRSMEAVAVAEKLVDEAAIMGVTEVKILHGKGTGALKEEIRAHLRLNPYVESLKDESVDLGGSGITVVRVKS